MTFPTYTGAELVEVGALNRVLFAANLRPVASINALPPESDATLALMYFRMLFREQAARGWYCFNKTDDQHFTPDADGEIILPAPAIKAETNPSARSFNRGIPEVRLDARTNKLMVWRNGLPVYKVAPLLNSAVISVDVVWLRDICDAPAEFITYVVAKTIEKFGPMVGVPVSPSVVKDAEWELDQAESAATPAANVHTDNPSLYTWSRR